MVEATERTRIYSIGRILWAISSVLLVVRVDWNNYVSFGNGYTFSVTYSNMYYIHRDGQGFSNLTFVFGTGGRGLNLRSSGQNITQKFSLHK